MIRLIGGPAKRRGSTARRRIIRKAFKSGSRARNAEIPSLIRRLSNLDSAGRLKICLSLVDNRSFDLNQLKTLKSHIEDKIQVDIISNVPYDLALYIVSFLSPQDLSRAAQTCRSWRNVCEDSRIWREKCIEEGLLDDEQTFEVIFKRRLTAAQLRHERIVQRATKDLPKEEWKAAYLRHISILRNWNRKEFKYCEKTNELPSLDRTQNQLSPLQQALPQNAIEPDQNRSNELDDSTAGPPASGLGGGSQEPRDAANGENSLADDNCTLKRFKPNENILNPGHTKPKMLQLKCHEDCVITCLQFNPRTHTIVSGSDDHSLKVWNSETGHCINTLEGHNGGVWSSQLSPDDIVISGSTDRTLKVWDAHSGELIHTLYGHTSTVRCLSLNGNNVVSGSRDQTLRLWNYVNGQCLHVLIGHNGAVRCVDYKNDIIVSGAYDYLVMVWDAITGNCLHALQCHESRIYSIQFDGRTIASGSLDASICIWDALSGKLRHRLCGHESLTSKLQLKGNLLVSANADSLCKVWDIKTGKCIHTLGGESNSENKHDSAITSVHFDNRRVVTSSDDGTVKLWDIKTGEFVRNLVTLPGARRVPGSGNGSVVWRIRASYNKLICAVGSRDHVVDTQLLILDFAD